MRPPEFQSDLRLCSQRSSIVSAMLLWSLIKQWRWQRIHATETDSPV